LALSAFHASETSAPFAPVTASNMAKKTKHIRTLPITWPFCHTKVVLKTVGPVPRTGRGQFGEPSLPITLNVERSSYPPVSACLMRNRA
jgi:hypothetical protein